MATTESILSMLDEDISNLDPSTLTTTTESAPVEDTSDLVEETNEDEAVTEVKESSKEEEITETTTNDVKDVVESPRDKLQTDKVKENVVKDTEVQKVEPVKTEEIDYKAAYTKLFTPFNANGKKITVDTVDDAISLMQMGANYSKKMAALKPNFKLMKLLENNGLMSEEKIGYLIDLEKKNPEAISKLVKDSGLDPMDLDADKASGYKPNTYTVDEREMELDVVLDEIQGTSTYNRTLDLVSTKWDGPSKQIIASTPQLLKVINDHMQSGIYDVISQEVDKERMFGRLNGLSDIDAYKKVGDAVQARGGFNHLSSQNPQKQVIAAPRPSKVDEDKLRDKKRAASSTKPAVASMPSKDFNPLAMSDEEFSKHVNKQFL